MYDLWVEYSSVILPGQNKLRVLSIGTDATVFVAGTETRSRLQAYAFCFVELHVISYVSYTSQFQPEYIAPNIWLYPVDSSIFFLRPLSAFRIGKRIIKERKINILSVQDPAETGLAGWLLKLRYRLPLHIQVHADFFSPYFRKNSWKERLRYWLARFIVPQGDAFRVVSQRVKKSLESRIKSHELRIALLPIFVDRERIALAKPAFELHQKYPQFDFIILMVSRLTREKNIGLAITAFAELLKKFPKTGLVIVGDGPERRKAELSAIDYSLSAHIKFEGWREDLISYYKTADLYLLTSNFEGYGRTVVEAATAGLPIVMTNVGVAGEIIRDGQTGRVVKVGDKVALVKALSEARRDHQRMKAMAQDAQKLARVATPRTFKEYLDKYCKSYEDILRN